MREAEAAPGDHDRADIARSPPRQASCRSVSTPMNRDFSHFPCLGRGIGFRDLPRHGKHHGNGVLCRSDRIAERRVHHDDAFAPLMPQGSRHCRRRCLHGQRPSDCPPFRSASRRHLGGRPDRQTVIVTDHLSANLSLSLPIVGIRRSTSMPRSRKICTAVSLSLSLKPALCAVPSLGAP